MDSTIIQPMTGLKTMPKGVFKNKDGYEVVLNADSYHMPRYLARGFVYLRPFSEVEEERRARERPHTAVDPVEIEILVDKVKIEQKEKFVCPICGAERDNATSLGTHKRTHKKSRR